TDPASLDNVGQNTRGLNVTERRQNQGGAFAIVHWDYFKSEMLASNVALGFQWNRIEAGPQGQLGSVSFENDPRYSPENYRFEAERPRHSNNVDRTVWYNGTAYQNDNRYTLQFDPSVTLRGKAAGPHEAKIGLQLRYMRRTFDFKQP